MALDDTKTLAERILRLEQKLQRLEKREGRPSVELFDNSAIRNRKIIDDLLVHNHTHANLSGLDADDHTQYLNTTRHDVTDRHTLGTVVPHDSHSSLSNLSNDDHTQYLNTTRHDTTDRHTLGTVVPHDDHGSLSGLADDDHPQYLLTTGKAADSDKLDGVDITAFKGLDSLTDPNADRVLFWDDSAGALKWLTLGTGLTITDTTIKPAQPQFYPLTTPLTSADWDGDSYSTTAKTLIDLSSVFGVPANVKAVLVRISARDSGSSTGYHQLILSPNDTANSASIQAYLQGVTNDVIVNEIGIVPCNADGDVYYQISASGTNTLDAWIEIWGYWL